jgi:Co/Zn/Cd efflux system component
MTELLALVKDFGMQAVITIAVLFGGWKLLCRMIDMLEASNARWQKIVEDLQKVIENTQGVIEQHRVEGREAHQYQRAEHDKLATLQDAQLKKADLQLEKADEQLKAMSGIEQAVGRINGYNHDTK